jgi:hypothetical protein
MTPEEFQMLLRATDAPFRRFLLALKLTGARPGELRDLRWDQIEWWQQRAVLPKHKTRYKTLTNRVIHFVPQVFRMLEVIRDRQTVPSDYVFLNARGRPWTRYNLAVRIKRLRKRLQLPLDCKLYGLRHFFISSGVKKGVNMKALAELVGHQTTMMIEKVYCHLGRDIPYMQEAAKLVVGGAFCGDDYAKAMSQPLPSPSPTAADPRIDGLQACQVAAYKLAKYAIAHNPEQRTDAEVYHWLTSNPSLTKHLPTLETFCKQLRTARRMIDGMNKRQQRMKDGCIPVSALGRGS